MNDRSQLDETVDQPSAGASVLQSLAANLSNVPRIRLREPLSESATCVNLPNTTEMSEPSRLQLIGEIARGGMGAIIKGRDVDLGRELAVKVLLEEHRGKAEFGCGGVAVQRFRGPLKPWQRFAQSR